jgi:hypothetical protein
LSDLALADFTQETNLTAEHRRLMDAHHRAVPWEQSTAASVPAPLRAMLADMWRDRMINEHRSVGIFSMYSLDLLGAGAPAEVLSLACRAALDEVRHAELFARLTSLYSGKPETPPPGIPPMPDDIDVPLRLQVAREAMHLSVAAETYSAVSLAELHARAIDPAVKGALAVVISDEIHHARMGWAFVRSLLADDADHRVRDWINADLRQMFVGLEKQMFGADPKNLPPPSIAEEDRALAEAHGYLSLREDHRLWVETMNEIWIPGLALLGLDVSNIAAAD